MPCTCCPRNCQVDRKTGELGFCGAPDKVKIARAALHFWEEPCISGTRGSGTIFFSGCNLACIFCQNQKISHNGYGAEITEERLLKIFWELREQGAHNINLVTPTPYIPHLISVIRQARAAGWDLPIVYNCGGYESVETLKLLNGYVDVYLTDMKFYREETAEKLCGVSDYFSRAATALREMLRQTGTCRYDKDGLMTKGVIVRHLMLPGYLFDSRNLLKYLVDNHADEIVISLMQQYTPPNPPISNAPDHTLRNDHYESMVDYLLSRGIENAFIQEPDTGDPCYIPPFNLHGVHRQEPASTL